MKQEKKGSKDQPKKEKELPRPTFSFPDPNQINDGDITAIKNEYPAISDIKKRTMIAAMIANLGIVFQAARVARIHRDTHYDWMKKDPVYKKAIHAIENISIDFTESHLFRNIAAGDTTAQIWHLKTKGKKRGYIDRQVIGFDDGDDSEIDSTLDL